MICKDFLTSGRRHFAELTIKALISHVLCGPDSIVVENERFMGEEDVVFLQDRDWKVIPAIKL